MPHPKTMNDVTITVNPKILNLGMSGETLEQIKAEYLEMLKHSIVVTIERRWENRRLVEGTAVQDSKKKTA